MPETDSHYSFGYGVQFDVVSEDTMSDLGLPYGGADGFNEYGVREHEDGSIDVIYRAMEPGVRNGANITGDYLQNVANEGYVRTPVQFDHSKSQHDHVGYINHDGPDGGVWFRDGALGVMFSVKNTGNQRRSDVIADFTYDGGPEIRDGSVQFDPRTIEYDLPDGYESFDEWRWDFLMGNDPEPFTPVDGELLEFTLTPFPGGYDQQTAGVSAAFNESRRGTVSKHSKQGQSRLVRDGEPRVTDLPFKNERDN